MAVAIRVQREDFSLADEWQALRARTGAGSGAIAAFAGLVRDDARGGGATETLALEHYPGMTESSIADIVSDAQQRWPLDAHRAAAFAGCEFIMDYLKTRAVFWKKEMRGSDTAWVRSTGDDAARAEAWQAGGLPDG